MAKEKATKDAIDQEENQNLRFYNLGRTIPSDAIKPIKAGRLKGMSDINPMWRMKRMTEIFGPVGFGWKYTIDRQWEEAHGSEVKVFCNISLYIRDPQTKEWSEPIIGCGGSAIVSIEGGSRTYVNDEAYKMALTDALSIAMKPIGIGADIWYGSQNANGHNESKYEQYTRSEGSYEELLPKALAEVKAINDVAQVNTVWAKYGALSKEFTKNGSPFYQAIVEKQLEFQC